MASVLVVVSMVLGIYSMFGCLDAQGVRRFKQAFCESSCGPAQRHATTASVRLWAACGRPELPKALN